MRIGCSCLKIFSWQDRVNKGPAWLGFALMPWKSPNFGTVRSAAVTYSRSTHEKICLQNPKKHVVFCHFPTNQILGCRSLTAFSPLLTCFCHGLFTVFSPTLFANREGAPSIFQALDKGSSTTGGTPNRWFTMENPIKMDAVRLPLFQETSISLGVGPYSAKSHTRRPQQQSRRENLSPQARPKARVTRCLWKLGCSPCLSMGHPYVGNSRP